jgi:hypothetical protein
MIALRLWISSIAGTISGASAARHWAKRGLAQWQAVRQQKKEKSGQLSRNHQFGEWLTDTVSYYH